MEIIERGQIEAWELEYICKKNKDYIYDSTGCKTRVLLEENDIFCQLLCHPKDDEKSVLRYAYICPLCGKLVTIPDRLISTEVKKRKYSKYLNEDRAKAWEARKKIMNQIRFRRQQIEIQTEVAMTRYFASTQEA